MFYFRQYFFRFVIFLVMACMVCQQGIALDVGFQPFEKAPTRIPSITAIDHAIVERIKLPRFEDGYVPQGLAVIKGRIIVSAYVGGKDWAAHRCTLFEFDPIEKKYRGPVLISERCRHGGGLAVAPSGELVVSDIDRLFVIELDSIDWRQTETMQKAIRIAEVSVSSDLKGGMTIGSSRAGLWLTRFSKSDPERVELFSWSDIIGKQAKQLRRQQALRSIEVPSRINGIAVLDDRTMWLSCSQGDDASLIEIDLNQLTINVKRYPSVGAIEDIDFDDDGFLWATSEGGTPQWKMKTYYPFLFKIDINKLNEITTNRGQ